MPVTVKRVKYVPVRTGAQAKDLRTKLGLSQEAFWKKVRVTQSCASRYESGRDIPVPVQILLTITYRSMSEADSIVADLRDGKLKL